MPLPFNGYTEKNCRVSATCLVSFDHNRYSVDCRHVGEVATARAYAEHILVLCAGELIGEHARCFGQGRTIYNPWHYVAALERKPGALRNGAPFKDWNLPAAMTRLRERLAKHSGGDRQFVEVLSMVALYGLEAVSDACADALEEHVVTSAHVVNLLHRTVASARAPLLQVPEALKLTVEPAANCGRYDRLLKIIHHPSENEHASPADRADEGAATARDGERVGGEPDGIEPQEARPDRLALPAPAG